MTPARVFVCGCALLLGAAVRPASAEDGLFRPVCGGCRPARACYEPCPPVGPIRRLLRRVFHPCCPPPRPACPPVLPVAPAPPVVAPAPFAPPPPAALGAPVAPPALPAPPAPLVTEPDPLRATPTPAPPGTGSSLRRVPPPLTPPTPPPPIRVERIASGSTRRARCG